MISCLLARPSQCVLFFSEIWKDLQQLQWRSRSFKVQGHWYWHCSI